VFVVRTLSLAYKMWHWKFLFSLQCFFYTPNFSLLLLNKYFGTRFLNFFLPWTCKLKLELSQYAKTPLICQTQTRPKTRWGPKRLSSTQQPSMIDIYYQSWLSSRFPTAINGENVLPLMALASHQRLYKAFLCRRHKYILLHEWKILQNSIY
jgi:hypothetical protein